jgi:hypothetical protein
MNLDAFSTPQVDSLLELLVLGMYVDGHLADAEDRIIKEFAREAGIQPGYNFDQAIDRAVSSVRQVDLNDNSLRGAVSRIAQVIDEPDIRQTAFEALTAIHTSDADDSPAETKFHKIVVDIFDL